MRRLLVLRPEQAAARTLDRARELGLDAVSVPLFVVAPVQWDAPDPQDFDGLLLTSANAILHGGPALEMLVRLPVYAVGEATAAAARQAGFAVEATGSSGVDELLAAIRPSRLLHLCGADRRRPGDHPHAIVELCVYRSLPIAAPELGKTGECVALVHSPAAARRFAELVADRSTIAIAAISAAAAQAAGSGWKAVHHSSRPGDDALLALAARLCNIPPLE